MPRMNNNGLERLVAFPCSSMMQKNTDDVVTQIERTVYYVFSMIAKQVTLLEPRRRSMVQEQHLEETADLMDRRRNKLCVCFEFV